MKCLIEWLVPRLITTAFYLLSWSIRWKIIGGEDWRREKADPCIVSFWHARLLMIPISNRKWNGAMLISEHRDGEFVTRVARMLGMKLVRGSSTRGGVQAYREMVRISQTGVDLALTPDGPKGPAEKVSDGVIRLAMRTGYPVRPVCYASSRFWRASSWDRFYVPLPLSKGVIVIGDPVYVSREDGMDAGKEKVQQAMDENRDAADRYFS